MCLMSVYLPQFSYADFCMVLKQNDLYIMIMLVHIIFQQKCLDVMRRQLYRLEQVLKRRFKTSQFPPNHHQHTSFTKNSVVLRCSCHPTCTQTSQGRKTTAMKASVQMAISIKLVLRMSVVVSRAVTMCANVYRSPLALT